MNVPRLAVTRPWPIPKFPGQYHDLGTNAGRITFRDGAPLPFGKLAPARYVRVQHAARRVR